MYMSGGDDSSSRQSMTCMPESFSMASISPEHPAPTTAAQARCRPRGGSAALPTALAPRLGSRVAAAPLAPDTPSVGSRPLRTSDCTCCPTRSSQKRSIRKPPIHSRRREMRSIASERSERAWRGAQNVLSRYQHCAVLNTIVAYPIVKSPLTNTPLVVRRPGPGMRNTLPRAGRLTT